MNYCYALLIFAMFLGIIQLDRVGNYNFQRAQDIQISQATNNIDCNDKKVVFAAGPYEAIEIGYYLSDCKIYFYSDQAKLGGGYAMLSNSKLRIVNPSTELDNADVIYYVHYGDAKLAMPADMTLDNEQKFDSLVVGKYQEK